MNIIDIQPDQSDREQDESRLALLDTACTACLHSKRWRESYMRSLPKGVLCQQTPAKKLFHFANGASSDGKLPVWRIPIFLGNRLGEVFSAELPSGTTPLLLSIPAMSALDMVLMMKDRVVRGANFEPGASHGDNPGPIIWLWKLPFGPEPSYQRTWQ